MTSKLLGLLVLVATTRSQLVDDFTCPDEFAGFYPHLISCDKYWSCQDGIEELRTCGNGLGFMDDDDTFTLEQCEELHLVECGERTELEPPISTENCPRLFGTFADTEDCGVFWKCQDGKPNKYSCPPGLAYDQEARGCRWADQVPECSSTSIVVDEEGGEFQCPRTSTAGVFTKHPHPADCRQYFLCIGGVPREQGCPLGSVFNTGSGSGVDGECSEPDAVPECANYYEGVDLDPRELIRSGFDSGKQDRPERTRSSSPRKPLPQSNSDRFNPNSIRSSSFQNRIPNRETVREVSRPAPPALQAIVASPPRSRPNRPQSRPTPVRQEEQFIPQPRPVPVRNEEPFLPSRLTISSPKPRTFPTEAPQTTQQQTRIPSRLQVITDRPNTRTTFPRRPTTEEPLTTRQRFNSDSRFSTLAPTTNSPPSTAFVATPASPIEDSEEDGTGLPPPVKAAPGPNGEDYYYYYYYYDDDEAENGASETPVNNNTISTVISSQNKSVL